MTSSTQPGAPPRTTALLGLVILGGAVGAAARAALLLPLATDPAPIAVPTMTLVINVAGSLLLGVVVGWLGSGSPRLRAFLGTGLLGGFTTYSAFAVQVVGLADGDAPIALLLAVVAPAFGVAAAFVGLMLGRRIGLAPIALPEDAE